MFHLLGQHLMLVLILTQCGELIHVVKYLHSFVRWRVPVFGPVWNMGLGKCVLGYRLGQCCVHIQLK